MKSISKNIKVEYPDNSEVEITAEIPAEEVKKEYKEVLKRSQEEMEIDGFRKGKAPLETVEKNMGQGNIMQKTAENILQREYPLILEDQKINPLGQPQVTITKIAPESDLGFKIKTATMPEVKLGNYKETAQKAAEENPITENPEVSEEEFKETVKNIRSSQALEEKRQKGEEVPSPESLKEEDLPAMTDEFVSSLGEFSDLEDFNKKIKEHLLRQKKAQEQEKQWTAILDSIIEESSIDLPQILIDSELDKMMAQLKEDVKKAGLEFSDYLSKIQKKEEDIRSEWKENAKKRAKTQLILNTIASKEGIEADPETVENQTNNILEQYKEADPEKVKVFVESQIKNEKTLSFLASIAEKNNSNETKKEKNSKEENSSEEDKS